MQPRRPKKRGSVCARSLGLALLLLRLAAAPQAAEPEARVLTLNGLDPDLSVVVTMSRAMRESLARDTERRVVYFSESLDSQRFSMAALEHDLVTLLEKKYQALPIDVVVVMSRLALDFYRQHGQRLWPAARVVFVGFLGHELQASGLPPGATAVVSDLDVSGTIAIARHLQPGARRIVVVSGVAEVDRAAEQLARQALAAPGGGVQVEFLSGLPLPELLDRVAAEPPDSIVVYLAQFRDRNGRPYEPHEVMRAIARTSRAPVYGAAETLLGLGTVAGSVASYESRGRLIGEQVRHALAGDPPDPARAVLAAPNGCAADARALQRWSLDERRLPSGCDIRFAEVSVWRQYGWQIGLTLAIVAAQSMLIASLISQRRRRRLAEKAELTQRAELSRAARFAMAGELTAAIAHEINQPLGAILSNADAGSLLLDSGVDRTAELREILSDIRRDDLRASEVIRRLRDLLGKHEVERKAIDLDEVVGELQGIMQAEARRRGIVLEIRRSGERLVTMADRVQIQQVLVNLVLNAMDAVADAAEARRTVEVSVVKGGRGAMLAVRDRGHGIAPEHRDRLFDSFFSTKPNGMGLGLSITKTIVEAHGGRVWVESGPGEGTVFRAEFPLTVTGGEPSPQPA